MSTEIYTLQTLRIKIVLIFLMSNPFGHTIFFTPVKHRMTNHKPDKTFFCVKEIVSDFPAISQTVPYKELS